MSNKILLHTDQHNINNQIATIQRAISYLNPYYDRYKGLNLPEMQSEDFQEFINNPKSFMVKILAEGDTLKIGKLELNPSKVYELFPLPDGVKELVEDIERITSDRDFSNYYLFALQQIAISENELIVKPDYVTHITNQNTFYAETPDQLEALEILKRVAQDLTALKALQKKPFINPNQWITEILKETNNNSKIEYSINLIKVRNY